MAEVALSIDPGETAPEADGGSEALAQALASRVERIVVKPGLIEIWPKRHEGRAGAPVLLPWSPPPVRRRREIIGGAEPAPREPMRAETRARLVSKVRAKIEHVFAEQKSRMGLFIRTIGIHRARTKIGLANLVYNLKRLILLERWAVLAT